ncbi:hypothetical protein ACO1GZ_02555 [Fusobacterium watanabei]|uniref:hypothetical protein n=1 Tax=Fusobacterium TaxID=848 RepID=UPI0030993D07
MKKLGLLFIIGLLIVSCGKDYEVYTKEQKKEMYQVALEEERNGKNDKIEEIHNILKKLEEAAKKGDKEAYNERSEWDYVIKMSFQPNSDPNIKADLLKRKW